MANAFTKAQFMEPPGSVLGPTPIGAVKAGDGIAISADGTITTTKGGGTINNIICTNGIQGGGGDPQVFIGLLPPTETTIGGVYTLPGSGISIDTNGLIRASLSFGLQAGPGITLSNITPESATISASVAGTDTANRGSVFVDPASNPGVQVSPIGGLSLTPPIGNGIGGVKAGPGCSIDPVTGVITATGSGGTITGVGAGTGLGGGGTTGAVSLFLKPPSGTTIGGVYAGQNVTIAADGQISVANSAGVQTVTKAVDSAIEITGTATNPIIGVFLAGTLSTGVCRLYDGIDGTPPIQTASYSAATPTAVKTVADLANTKLPLAGGAMTGPITFTAGQTFPGTVDSGAFTQLGGILVGDNSPPGYAQLPVGANGQFLAANSASPLGVEWVAAPVAPTLQQVTANGATTNLPTTFQGSAGFGEQDLSTVMDGRSISFFTVGTADPLLKIDNQPGGSQALLLGPDFLIKSPPGGTIIELGNRVPGQGSLTVNGSTALNLQLNLSTKVVLDSTGFSVNTSFRASNLNYPTADGAAGAALVTNGSGTLSFSTGFLQKAGGTMAGDITFAGTQTFPGVLIQGAISATGALEVGGTPANPILSVDTATTAQLGVVQPDGTTITIDGSGVISAVTGSGSLPLSGGTMTGDITFAATQTFPGTISSALLDATGDIVYASGTDTPASLPIGAAGTILAVNAGLPAWRTSLQLGLLTTTAAASTYAPLDSPVFTGPVTVNGAGAAGANALTVSGGNLVLATSFTPASSSATGSVGELAWDNTGYLYFCYAPNTWGRVQIDLTPF